MSCDGVLGGICFLLCLIVLDGAFFSFRPFRAIMWGGVLLCCYPGCYPGLTRLIPFQGIFCSSAEFCFAITSFGGICFPMCWMILGGALFFVSALTWL